MVGCGGSQKGAEQPERSATVAASEDTEEDLASDLTPVAAPEGLIMVGRWRSPAQTFDTVMGWSGVPLSWRTLLQRGAPGADAILSFDAPVEFAVVLDANVAGLQPPKVSGVVSVGVTSLQATLDYAATQGEEVRRLRGQTYRVDLDDVACAISPALGKAPTRLVCGQDFGQVETLLPYATRGLPLEALSEADIQLEFRPEHVRRSYGTSLRQLQQLGAGVMLNELAIDNRRFDRALASAYRDLTNEALMLLDDTDRLSVSVDVDPKSEHATLAISADFRSSSSWTVGTFLTMNQRAMPAPRMFWQLPDDVVSAYYAVPVESRRYENIRNTLGDLVEGYLEQKGVPQRIRDQLAAILQTRADSVQVYGEGAVPSSAGGTMDAAQEFSANLGWHLLGFETLSAAEVSAVLQKAERVTMDPTTQKLLRDRVGLDKPPTIRRGRAQGGGLPAGVAKWELVFTSADAKGGPQAKSAQLRLFLFVVPAAEGCWVGFAADEPLLRQKLAQVLAGKDSLERRVGLEALRRDRAVTAGFTSIRDFGGPSALQALGVSHAQRERIFDSMPQHGQTPMLTELAVEPKGSGASVVWSLRAPKAVVQDVAAVVPFALAPGLMH